MKPLSSNHSSLFDLPVGSAPNGLYVVARCNRVDPVSPQVRTKIGEGETWISLDQILAELCAWFATRSCAKIEILDGSTDPLGECAALVRLGSEEPGSKIHVSTKNSVSAVTIDQNDLREKRFALPLQIFLHVDQND
jgi:hypothetical protein